MRTLRSILLVGLLAALGACGQPATPTAPAAAAAAPPTQAPVAAPAGATPGDGPRLVMSPDNVHIEYRVFGQGPVAVVLIHGWACDANYWNQQLEALKAHYTVVAMNLAGHGGSASNRSDWTIANYAADVAVVAKQIPNAQIILVGHSMGATVAIAAAPLIGDRVIGIVAVDALRSVGLPPLPDAEIQKHLAPFRADFVGATRKLVTESLFPRSANRTLVQKVAYDMSLESPASRDPEHAGAAVGGPGAARGRDPRAGVRDQLGPVPDGCGPDPQVAAELHARCHRAHRRVSDA